MTAKKCAKKRDARAKLIFANQNLLVHFRSPCRRCSRWSSSIVYRGCRMPILVPMGILGCGMRDAGWGLRDWRKIWVGMTVLKNSNKGNPRTRFNIKKKCWKNIFHHRNNNSQNNSTASSDPETYNPWPKTGQCDKNPDWMLDNCKKSCSSKIKDSNPSCPAWGKRGECTKNPSWMLPNCKLSCMRIKC